MGRVDPDLFGEIRTLHIAHGNLGHGETRQHQSKQEWRKGGMHSHGLLNP
ncbi:hypothetical protein D187_003639 [Cystobacter fuscus DSM 2262]|uniref:Uncharacterized protein n=1 Tax=Cystobacter fuscus (strain ATCC 25194 / DSM 2262 / NBRC 100088 / M29) TaxID=1242864 RepID=S9QC58_CYSF2|nr:hypothetical protein D187_003639 [Cystobacter fuscus DSM 2262]